MPQSKRKERPHAPEAGWAFLCFRDIGLRTGWLTDICLPSHISVHMETAENHSKVTEPFPHPWHGAELSHAGAHVSSCVSPEPVLCHSKAIPKVIQGEQARALMRTWAGACETCSQNTCSVPPWSCAISALCAPHPGGITKAQNSIVTCRPEWAVGMRTHQVRTGFCLVHVILERTLCLGVCRPG